MRYETFVSTASLLGLLSVGLYPIDTIGHDASKDAAADQDTSKQGMMGPGFMIPLMDSGAGRRLFASKGCVVCHAVNGIGGEDATPLDAATMPSMMNPFEFAARM